MLVIKLVESVLLPSLFMEEGLLPEVVGLDVGAFLFEGQHVVVHALKD